VKQTEEAGRLDVFEAVLMRENRQEGFIISFDFTSDAETEMSRFLKKTGKVTAGAGDPRRADRDEAAVAFDPLPPLIRRKGTARAFSGSGRYPPSRAPRKLS